MSFPRRFIPRCLRAAVVAVLFAASSAHAQPSGEPPFYVAPEWKRFRATLARFDSLEARGRRAEAWVFLDSLVAAQRSSGDRSRLMQALIRRGGTRVFRGDYRRGEPDLAEAATLATALRDTLGEIMSTQYRAYGVMSSGDFARAAPLWNQCLRRSIQRRDPSHEGWARMGLAFIDLRSGRIARARAGYARVIRLMQSCGDVPGLLEARTGHANVLSRLDRLAEADAEYGRLVAEAAANRQPIVQANAQLNRASVAWQRGDGLSALSFVAEAERLYRASGNRSGARAAAVRRADLLHSVRHFEASAKTLAPLVAEARAQGAHDEWAELLSTLASARRGQGRFGECEQILRTVRTARESVSARPREAAALDLASLLHGVGRAREALRLLDSIRTEPGWPASTTSRARDAILESFAQLALDRPTAALETLNGTTDIGLPSDALSEWYGAWLARARAWTKLERADSARAALATAIAKWREGRNIATDLAVRETRGEYAGFLVEDVVDVAMLGANPQNRGARERSAFEQLQELKSLTLRERMESGLLVERSAERSPLALPQVQRALADGELLLDMHVGFGGSVLFAITRTRLVMVRLPRGGVLNERIERALGPIASTSADTAASRAAADALAELVWPGLAPLLQSARRIVVSPAGPLHDVPFAMLPARAGGPPIATFAEVVHAPSVSVLLHQRTRPKRGNATGIFAFAGTRNARGERLTGATDEVNWLARRYAGTEAKTSEQIADRGVLARRLAHAEVLHLAGHTSTPDEQPWLSGLLVGTREGADAYLRAAEIAGLRLPARLVVLSACQSAGQWTVSEGTLGLSSAFLSAGVPSVVATQWPIRDAAAAAFTREFYPRLAAGQDAASALRGAQLALRASPATAAPVDWAGFALVGDGSVRVTLRPVGISLPRLSRP